MTTQTAERQELHRVIDMLPDDSVVTALDFIKSLRRDLEELMEELEDAEDIAYIDSLTPEDYSNAVSIEEIKAKYRAVKS